MSNRQQRRAANKKKPAYLRESPQELAKKLVKNGITADDLKRNYDTGFADGFKAAGEPIVKGCFAAVCLALNELHGFGKKRCYDVLSAVDRHMLYSLTTDEAIQEVWDKIGLQLLFDEPFDRVQEIDRKDDENAKQQTNPKPKGT